MLKKSLLFLFVALSTNLYAQFKIGVGAKESNDKLKVDYATPKEYTIGGITVSGTKFLDQNTLISVSGLNVGDKVKIPGERITTAVRKLMEQGIIEDVDIALTKVEGTSAFLDILLKERPRLSKFIFTGIRKGEHESVTEKIKLNRGKVITDALIKNTQLVIKRYYADKGFTNANIQITQLTDSIKANNAAFKINIAKGKRVKIETVELVGVEKIPDWKVRTKLKSTKQMRFGRIFTPSKYIYKKYEEDKVKLIEFYNKQGFRDARIIADSVIAKDGQHIKVMLNIDEGRKYYYRNITWAGNYLQKEKLLNDILGLKKGDVYNTEDLEKRLNGIPQGDVSSLYMDDGYLFFRCEPIEVAIEGDSVDVEMRITEGKQATINKIILNGNTKTSDHVVMREIRTLPGQKFSKTALIRTQRELSTLGYFNAEKIGINPVPQNDGTVNIEYTVEEKSSDQIELSGGWGGLQGFVGTFGITFNNFSIKNIANLKSYRPLPAGDGQKVSIRMQASGQYFQTYSLSFTEPWFGGKKPNSFAVSLFHSSFDNRGLSEKYQQFQNSQYGAYGGGGLGGGLGGLGGGFGGGLGGLGGANDGYFKNTGASITFGKRLKFPDDFFVFNAALSYQRYNVNNYPLIRAFQSGVANDLSLGVTLSRNSIDQPQFPRTGSSFTLNVAASPPYSSLRPIEKILGSSEQDQYRWLEMHKWMFDASWFTPIVGKLVFNARAHMGFTGRYNSKLNYSPFGRFILGGAGMGAQGTYNIGSEIIGLRGYDEGVIGPNRSSGGGIAYNKFVLEARYPVSLNPSATIFVLGFLEGGSNWGNYSEYNPFKIRRSAGVGARIFMSAFGLIGIDYGKGFDPIPGLTNQGLKTFTFSIGQQIR